MSHVAHSHSYEFKASDVFDVCVDYLKKRDEQIAERRENMIRELINQPKSWWHFWRKRYDRESAIAHLKESEGYEVSAWDRPEFYGSHWKNICFDLIVVVSQVNSGRPLSVQNTITLHDETATFIGGLILRCKNEV